MSLSTCRLVAASVSLSVTLVLGAGAALAEVDTSGLWKKNCASCHGEDGRGDTKIGKLLKVVDYTDPKVQAGFDRTDLVAAVKDGVKNDKGKFVMKGYATKLQADEIEALVDHVLAFSAGSAQATDEPKSSEGAPGEAESPAAGE